MILRTYKAPKRDARRDSAYLRWVRTMPCIVCGSMDWVEAAHVGQRGLGQKCPDKEALPLCEAHHRTGPRSHHVLGRNFWTFWNLSRHQLISDYNRLFENARGR